MKEKPVSRWGLLTGSEKYYLPTACLFYSPKERNEKSCCLCASLRGRRSKWKGRGIRARKKRTLRIFFEIPFLFLLFAFYFLHLQLRIFLALCIREETSISGGQGKFKGSLVGLCCWNPSILTPSCLRQNAWKIATLFKTLNSEIECFFKVWRFQKNLYQEPIWAPAYTMQSGTHTEWAKHGSFPPERVRPSVNFQGRHFPYMEAKKQCICYN